MSGHKASQDRSMNQAAKRTGSGPNNPQKAQGHVPQRETKPPAPKPKHSQPLAQAGAALGHSSALNSVLPSPPRGNAQLSHFFGVHGTKAGGKMFQDQSPASKQSGHTHAHAQKAQNHAPTPKASPTHQHQSGKNTANNASPKVQVATTHARGQLSASPVKGPENLSHKSQQQHKASSHPHLAQEASSKGHKNTPPKPPTNDRRPGQPPSKSVPPTLKASPSISSARSKGTGNRSSDSMNPPGSKRNSSTVGSGSLHSRAAKKQGSNVNQGVTSVSKKRQAAVVKALSLARGMFGKLPSLIRPSAPPIDKRTRATSKSTSSSRKAKDAGPKPLTYTYQAPKLSKGNDGSSKSRPAPTSSSISPRRTRLELLRKKAVLSMKGVMHGSRDVQNRSSKSNTSTLPRKGRIEPDHNKGTPTRMRSDAGLSPGTSTLLMKPRMPTNLTLALSHFMDRSRMSSKHQAVRGSSTVKAHKSTSVPRRKEFQVRSSSSKVLSQPPKRTTTLRKSLLRQRSPTLIWSTSDKPGIVSAYSTLTAAPLPSPPRNGPQNKVARRTIARNPGLFKVVTPIKINVFKRYLRDHPNQPFVKSVLRALKHGFWPWADTSDPKLPTTYDGASQRCPIIRGKIAKFIREQRDEEVKLKRWSKPFGKKLLPGMYSSPISAVPKSTPGKYRLIIDQSCGPHALNSTIPKSKVKVKLDNIHDLGTALLVAQKKYPERKLCLYKSDVKSAYRQLSMHPLFQIKQVVSVDGQCHVDRCNTFGNRGGGWIWDSFISLVNWIGTEKKKIPNLLGYVDDNFGWDFAGNKKYYKPYKKYFPTNQVRLLELWDELGIPHDKDKQLSGPSLPIIGFNVDPNAMTVKVPDEKKAAVVQLLRGHAREGKSYTLSELQSVAGSVSHVLSLYPRLRPGLRALFDEMAGKEGAGTKLRVTKHVARSLSELANYLERARPVPIRRKKETVPVLRARTK